MSQLDRAPSSWPLLPQSRERAVLAASLPPPVLVNHSRAPQGRAHRRATLRTEIWLGEAGIFTRSRGVLRDLSEGGAFVKTVQRFSIGSVLSLRFRLPKVSQLINGTVAVKNTRNGTGVGVKFIDLSDLDRWRVREFVDRYGASPD